MRKFQTLFTVIFIIVFILIFYLVLIPKGLDVSIILLIGFSLIIVGFFYFFIKLINSNNKSYNFKYKGLTENSIKIILIILMFITFFIPRITFSDIIIDWNQISLLNYLRGTIYLLGSLFLPGASIFNILFPKNTLHEQFKIEPFFIKMVFYPLISFSFLGTLTLILDKIGLNRTDFSFVLFLVIIILFILDLLLQKHSGKNIILIKKQEINLSKYTIFIIFIAISIIILSLGLQLEANYLPHADNYRANIYTNLIGLQETAPYDKFFSYAIYWSYITFSLSSLTGIPVININAMLFPFIYLSILSLYLFMKVFLKNFKEIYAVLATILAVTFSSIFQIFHSYTDPEFISLFPYISMFCFFFKSYAFILFTASMALFISGIKDVKLDETKPPFNYRTISIIILSTFLLLQSYMIYFIPLIPAIFLILLFIIFTGQKRYILKYCIFFIGILIGFYIFVDIVTDFFFSYYMISLINYFFNINLIFSDLSFSTRLLFNAIFVYSFLIGFLTINLLIYNLNNKNYFRKFKIKKKLKFNPKYIFIAILIFFTEFLIFDIIFNLIGEIYESNFSTFILHLFYLNIGFVGVSGIYLSYYSFKKNRQIFYISIIWIIILFILSWMSIFSIWFQYPHVAPHGFDDDTYFQIYYWFTRTWYYSIIPLSILCSIGLFKLKKILSSKFHNKRFHLIPSLISKLLLTSFFVIIALSNTIIVGIMWYNYGFNLKINNEEAQLIGWISKNTPQRSKILVDRGLLMIRTDDIMLRTTYMIDYELQQATFKYKPWDVNQEIEPNCSIALLDKLNNFTNVIEFSDQNNSRKTSISTESAVARSFGEIQFHIKTSDKNKNFLINLKSVEGIIAISFEINSNAFYIYNGLIFQKLMDIENNTWYHVQIIFDCATGNYLSLTEYLWKVVINGINFGEFNFLNNRFIKNLYFSTADIDSDYKIYLSNFNFSWAPTLKLEYCIFRYLIIFDHLRVNNITYFVYSKEETENNKNAEAYIDIENELIAKFYQNKLYEYKYLAIYSLIFH